jgi:hypothetical protein
MTSLNFMPVASAEPKLTQMVERKAGRVCFPTHLEDVTDPAHHQHAVKHTLRMCRELTTRHGRILSCDLTTRLPHCGKALPGGGTNPARGVPHGLPCSLRDRALPTRDIR